jgi:hypothetical protein
MKTAIFAALVASAGAFAPATKPVVSTALNSYENELGVIAPTGFFGMFFFLLIFPVKMESRLH